MDEPVKEPGLAESVSEAEAEYIPVSFNIPMGLASRYAHHLMVQSTEHEVMLSFFEIMPPPLIGSPEEQREALKKGIRADCVSRVAIARGRYPEFVKAMVGQLKPEEKKEVCE